MAFADSVSRVDEACLRVFGREVLYLPEAGGSAAVLAPPRPLLELKCPSCLAEHTMFHVKNALLRLQSPDGPDRTLT